MEIGSRKATLSGRPLRPDNLLLEPPGGRVMSHVNSVNPRSWGCAPYRVALVHGGPGGVGEMMPLARELSASGHGVLEPFQTAFSVDAQVGELRDLLDEHAPLILIGFSWGAWLPLLVAARCHLIATGAKPPSKTLTMLGTVQKINYVIEGKVYD